MDRRVKLGNPQNTSNIRRMSSPTITTPVLFVPRLATSPPILLVALVVHEQSRLFRSFGMRRASCHRPHGSANTRCRHSLSTVYFIGLLGLGLLLHLEIL